MSETENKTSEIFQNLLTTSVVEIFTSMEGDLCVTLTSKGKDKTYNANSSQFKHVLNNILRRDRIYLSEYKMKELITFFNSEAYESEARKDVFIRVGNCDDKVIVDLNNDENQFVVIDKNGWSITGKSPVPFVRPTKQLPMPLPKMAELKHFLKMFQELFNLKNFENYKLILAFILQSLNRGTKGGFPILIFEGRHGEGKSTASVRTKKLIDSTMPVLFTPPKNTEDILVITNSSYLLAFDNLSGMTWEMADTFCRVATAAGISKRVLFTNDTEKIYNIKRPVILNGIEEPSHRPDFVDRSILIQVRKSANFVSDETLTAVFNEQYPLLLGGLYSLLSRCLALINEIPDNNLPRMADFAKMGIAMEIALNLPPGDFLKTYYENINEQVENAFSNDDICCLILAELKKRKNNPQGVDSFLQGASGELLKKLGLKNIDPRRFSGHLKRIGPLLSRYSIIVEDIQRTGTTRGKVIRFKDDDSFKESQRFSDVDDL